MNLISLHGLSNGKIKQNLEFLSRYFYNWTWGFRPESDIIESYGYNLVNKKLLPPTKRWSSRIINLSSTDVDL